MAMTSSSKARRFDVDLALDAGREAARAEPHLEAGLGLAH